MILFDQFFIVSMREIMHAKPTKKQGERPWDGFTTKNTEMQTINRSNEGIRHNRQGWAIHQNCMPVSINQNN